MFGQVDAEVHLCNVDSVLVIGTLASNLPPGIEDEGTPEGLVLQEGFVKSVQDIPDAQIPMQY